LEVESDVTVTELKRMRGRLNGRPGYEVDHIVPLSRGGADKPSNMQWLTIAEHKEKTRREMVR
jgi:5-methylcytosine-specific restriction endonuclease McrA